MRSVIVRKVSVKGVLIGGVVDVFTSVLLGLLFAFYAMSKLNVSQVPKDQIGPSITAAIHGNLLLYWGELLVGLACSVLGGYVAAWLARHDELLNGALSASLCVFLGIYTISLGKDTNPHWLQILMLAASPAFSLIGGDLRRRQRNRHAMLT